MLKIFKSIGSISLPFSPVSDGSVDSKISPILLVSAGTVKIII